MTWVKEFTPNYTEYINSEEWKRKADERKKIDGHKCVMCGKKNGLEVHHITYKNFKHENVKEDLVTLCKECHEEVHNNKEYVIDGIIRAFCIRQIDMKGGRKKFLSSVGITDERVVNSFIDWENSNMAVLYLPVDTEDLKGAFTVPFYAGGSCKKDLEKMLKYIGESYNEQRKIATKLYLWGLEVGGYIDRPKEWGIAS